MAHRPRSQSPPPPAARPSDLDLDTHASAVAAAISSASPPNIPYNVLSQWTNGFSENNLIGQGSFGNIYLAICHDSRKARARVAVKWYSPLLANTAATSSSTAHLSHADVLRREINVLRSFHHPHIIQLLGFSMPLDSAAAQSSDTLCLVYEYAARGGLDKMLRDDTSARLLSWQLRVRIMLQIATALNFMHKRFSSPAYHRDVKSSNVVITDDFTAKLIDCGLSKYVPDKGADAGFSVTASIRGVRFGTSQYMCPTYTADGNYNAKSEIFSFGLVMAELLTGLLHLDPKAPLNSKLKLSDQRVLHDIPPDLRAGDWPGAAVSQLKALVLTCTASNNMERPPDMAIVMRELRVLLDQHCPASASASGNVMIAELAAARAALDLMRLDKQFQDMQQQRARTAAPQLQCCVCQEDVAANEGWVCSGEAPGHLYCNECLSNMVVSQVTGEGKPVFLAAGCEVTCAFCQAGGAQSVFDMQFTIPHLTTVAFHAYSKTMAEPEVMREQLQWQQRMQKQEAEFAARLENAQRASVSAVGTTLDPHMKHISDELILPRCPKQSCRRFIPDFEGCAALQVLLLECHSPVPLRH